MRPTQPTRRRLARAIAGAASTLLLAACGSAASTSASASTGTTAVTGTTASTITAGPSVSSTSAGPGSAPATSAAPSALDQLAGFVAGAQDADAALAAAAGQINAGITAQSIRIDAATVRAVAVITPQRLKSAIPGGLPDQLLRPALLVYSDLVSRRDALNRISEYASESPLPRTAAHATELLGCLRNGASAAANVPADLARLRSTAQGMAPVTVAPVSDRAAAEVAIRTSLADGANGGCASCGGQVDRSATLWPITWKRTELTPGDFWDGTIGTMLFRARYTVATGWSVQLNAC